MDVKNTGPLYTCVSVSVLSHPHISGAGGSGVANCTLAQQSAIRLAVVGVFLCHIVNRLERIFCHVPSSGAS